jgi:predicted N-acetyltransferase YhbS
MKIRELTRAEVPYVWQINRREVIENIYYVEDEKLILKPEHYDMSGWPIGKPEH